MIAVMLTRFAVAVLVVVLVIHILLGLTERHNSCARAE